MVIIRLQTILQYPPVTADTISITHCALAYCTNLRAISLSARSINSYTALRTSSILTTVRPSLCCDLELSFRVAVLRLGVAQPGRAHRRHKVTRSGVAPRSSTAGTAA